MKIDLLLVQAAILFLPGIIWARLDAKYAMKTKPSEAELALRAIVFGLVSYAVTFALYEAAGRQFLMVDLEAAQTRAVVTRDVAIEIGWAVLVGFILALIWIYAATYKWLTRFLQWMGATKTYGDEDVWDFTFNARIPAVEYINPRDFDKKLIYSGWVRTFSESSQLRELVLRDAKLFDFDGRTVLETPLLYIARKPENIDIEFPYRQEASA